MSAIFTSTGKELVELLEHAADCEREFDGVRIYFGDTSPIPPGCEGDCFCECPICWAVKEQIAAELPNSPAARRVAERRRNQWGGCSC